jgi:glutamate-1-semialdehyde 2,1-aminomutase
LGGGFPIGAFGGKAEIMDLLSPDGPVYQAGTLSGNPVAVEAGIATIRILMRNKIYDKLQDLGDIFEAGMRRIISRRAEKAAFQRCASLFTLFFTGKKELLNYDDVSACDTGAFALFFRRMLERGIYLAPSQFEANFISARHTAGDIDKTLKAAESALKK